MCCTTLCPRVLSLDISCMTKYNTSIFPTWHTSVFPTALPTFYPVLYLKIWHWYPQWIGVSVHRKHFQLFSFSINNACCISDNPSRDFLNRCYLHGSYIRRRTLKNVSFSHSFLIGLRSSYTTQTRGLPILFFFGRQLTLTLAPYCKFHFPLSKTIWMIRICFTLSPFCIPCFLLFEYVILSCFQR
jgi:hypothetical protein